MRWYAVQNPDRFSPEELVALTGPANQKKLPLFLPYSDVERFQNFFFGCARVTENGEILYTNDIAFNKDKIPVHYPARNTKIVSQNETYWCM